MHPAHLGLATEILGDMISRPLFKEIDVEREVILEEMLDEVDEDGRDIDVDNLSKQTLFAGHPLALKIAGTPDTVRALSLRQAARKCQRRAKKQENPDLPGCETHDE